MAQNIRIGDNATIGGIAQGARDVTQHVMMGSTDHAELRHVLGELTEAIRGLDRSVKDKAVALAIAEQVTAAVDAPDRDVEQTASWWDYLGRFADSLTVAGALGAPTTVPALYQQASPLLEHLLRAAGGG